MSQERNRVPKPASSAQSMARSTSQPRCCSTLSAQTVTIIRRGGIVFVDHRLVSRGVSSRLFRFLVPIRPGEGVSGRVSQAGVPPGYSALARCLLPALSGLIRCPRYFGGQRVPTASGPSLPGFRKPFPGETFLRRGLARASRRPCRGLFACFLACWMPGLRDTASQAPGRLVAGPKSGRRSGALPATHLAGFWRAVPGASSAGSVGD